ncbi:MAG: glutathione S-transferase [Kordiimonadales bacterium]|nr:MAG: glutathione S-transferase [Kordiimonadales bacterium]
MSNTIRIHRHALSGHSHRVELFASLAGIKYETIDVDLANGEHLNEPFLSLNPFGQVPVLEDGDAVITDSNAILVYLARKYAPAFIPTDVVLEAEVQRFLSVVAGEIAFGPAAARLVTVFGAPLNAENAIALAHKSFAKVEAHLAGRTWLVGNRPTIADVAFYSYTQHAPEGNVSLADYPNIRGLLSRISELKGFIAMGKTEVGLAA